MTRLMAATLPVLVPAPLDEDAVYRRIAWRLLPLLMLAWLFSYIDRVNIGFSDAVYGFMANVVQRSPGRSTI